ncbi:hypothetical protein F0562_010716 [Nyssa sinensis]|uniref:LOB domain-containing protein n=1 Tax=Nyssa sinensis TaxID=561372 RepID=A0A5J4ZZQ2_9ASTE|nr:hypothetical protein F0562_010716 [Nyssa sinensis]
MQRNNGMPACASCKHQRKKCNENCVLAPFFPAEKSREFQAVHKLFGVSNVTKIVKNLKEEDRKRAIDSLAWEAICRQKDPVLGPYGEYRRVYDELKFYKSQSTLTQGRIGGGGMVYKSAAAPGLSGWNSNNGMCEKGMSIGGGVNNSNHALNYIHSNGSCMVDSSSYGYPSNHDMQIAEKVRHERDITSVVILPQPHSVNGFNQQYYLPGQFSTIDEKPMESPL